jgi:hypothetical protein
LAIHFEMSSEMKAPPKPMIDARISVGKDLEPFLG